MNIRAKTLLYDVLESGRCIRDWCVGHSFTDYEANHQFRRAVEREFEIINRIIHGYGTVDDATVWGLSRAIYPTSWLRSKRFCGRRAKLYERLTAGVGLPFGVSPPQGGIGHEAVFRRMPSGAAGDCRGRSSSRETIFTCLSLE